MKSTNLTHLYAHEQRQVAIRDGCHGDRVDPDQDDGRVLPSGRERVVYVERETHAVRAVEVAVDPGEDDREECNHGTAHPQARHDGHAQSHPKLPSERVVQLRAYCSMITWELMFKNTKDGRGHLYSFKITYIVWFLIN